MFKFGHSKQIRRGTLGEISKIQEEVAELVDAKAQGHKLHAIIEASDVIGAVGLHTWKHYGVPLLGLVFLALIRVPYKLALRFANRATLWFHLN